MSKNGGLPIALIHQGINEIGVTAAFCSFSAGIITVSGHRLGRYRFSVENVNCFSTDSKEFWGLWQFDVKEIPTKSTIHPSPAPFIYTAADSTGLMKNLFHMDMSPSSSQCIFAVLRIGAATHSALERLQAFKIDLDVNERTEVALIVKSGLEDLIKLALCGGKDQALPSSMDQSLIHFSCDSLSMNRMMKASTLTLRHLEASACLSAAVDFQKGLTVGRLLARCGIPLPSTSVEQELLLKQILGIEREPAKLEEESNTTKNPEQLRLETFGLGAKNKSNSLMVTILTGIHGSYMTEIGSCIAKVGKANTVWMILHPKQLAEVPPLLTSSLKEKAERETSGENRSFRCLIVAPLWISVPEILTEVESFFMPDKGNPEEAQIRIVSTITCVDPRMCLMGPEGLIMPGLCPFFNLGWTNILVLTTPEKTEKKDDMQKATHLIQAIRQLNPRAVVLSAPFGKIRDYTQLNLLLNDDLFDEIELQRHRLLTYASHCSSLGEYVIKKIFVEFRLPLERARWTAALKGLVTNLSPLSDEPIIVYVDAHLAFDDDANSIHHCCYWPQIDTSKESRSPHHNESGDKSLRKSFSLTALFFTSQKAPGIRPDYNGDCEDRLTQWLKAWLRTCLRQAEKLKPLIEKEKLSESELDKINDMYQLHPLPDGWYFTGTQYVHIVGDRSFRHPCFDRLVDEYVAQENEKIKQFNASLINAPVVDLFD
uniref:HA2 domain-containing protein n=1 Tax=Mesocestoides corti TaxID=53468 RepID=A0A5K3FS17_MESCO